MQRKINLPFTVVASYRSKLSNLSAFLENVKAILWQADGKYLLHSLKIHRRYYSLIEVKVVRFNDPMNRILSHVGTEQPLPGSLSVLYEPRREKTGLRGFRPGPTQTGLYKLRKELEA